MLAARYDGVLFDLDGVLYRGDQTIEGASAIIDRLRGRGCRLLFLTNNSSRTAERVAEKLRSLGIAARPEDVLTSGLATAQMLEREGLAGSTAFVIGERGIVEPLERAGVHIVDGEAARADLVIVGWDRSVDYAKLRTASLLVQRGARLVATNDDASYPAPDGLWPGAGAILAAVTTATGAVPTVVGKPGRPLFEAAADRLGAVRPLMVGDRLETDVRGAETMGWDSLLVLTGAATLADVAVSDDIPTFVAQDLGFLLEDPPLVRFGSARPSDAEAVASLLRDVGLPDAGVGSRLASSVAGRVEPGGQVVATAAVEPAAETGLLRSVAVREDLRRYGLGILATAHALRLARGRSIRRFYLFTETATTFFARLGFREIDRSELPEAVLATSQARDECAISAVAMELFAPAQ